MNLFYVEPAQISESSFTLEGQEAQHASRVLRHKIGDEIHATDGKGSHLIGSISDITKQQVVVDIKHLHFEEPAKQEIILGLGFIKKRDRLEFAIEKAVEVGAHKIALINTRHAEKAPLKKDRLDMITLSAMKQSLRFYLPVVEVFDSLDACLQAYDKADIIIAHKRADRPSETVESHTDQLLLLVGPEGGFSDEEATKAVEQKATMVSLGSKRLRAETAAIVLLSKYV